MDKRTEKHDTRYMNSVFALITWQFSVADTCNRHTFLTCVSSLGNGCLSVNILFSAVLSQML